MGNSRNTGYLTNVIKVDNSGNVSFVSGSTTLATINTTGQFSGSAPAVSASYAASASNALAAATASYILTAQTASYVLNGVSASYAASASNALAAQTASYVLNGVSASYAASASNALSASNAVTAQTASFANTFTVASTLTAQTLVVQTITSSVDFVTGSTRFGSLSSNTHVFTGSILTSGSVGIGTTPDNTYQGLTIYGSDPSLRLKTSNPSGWTWIEFVNNSGTNNFSMGVNQTTPYFGIKSGAGMDNPSLAINISGSVGIGTSNPSRNLHVASSGADVTIAATRNGTDSAQIGVDSVSYIGAGGDITIRTGGFTSSTERIRVNSSGNVGIGTNNPTVLLHVKKAVNSDWVAAFDNTGTNPYGVRIDTSANAGVYSLAIYTNTGTGFYVSNNGRVGIGTTSPSYPLEVNGAIYAKDSSVYFGNSSGGADRAYVYQSGARFNYGSTRTLDISVTNGLTSIYTNYYSGGADQPIVLGTYGNNSNQLYLQVGGNISMNTTTNAAALNIGATDTRKLSFETNSGVRSTTLFKSYSMNGVAETWCRIRLENNYAQNFQGVWGVITVAYHPYHASMGRFYQYRFQQSPYGTNNSYMKIVTVYEEAFGWDYYQFSSDVQFYNFENYLYIKVIGRYDNINYIRSVRADLTGGNVAMDSVQLEVDVAAPARLGLITKNGAAALSA